MARPQEIRADILAAAQQVTRRGDRYEREVLGPVIFMPLLQGLA